MENIMTKFTIGHHDSKTAPQITAELVAQAYAANYDLVTTPITTAHFQSRVLASLSEFASRSAGSKTDDTTKSHNASPVVISPLTPADTPLTPNESISQCVAVTSSWIDLSSPDPVIADISRQVLRLELTYAAFCGLTYVLIPGPRLKGLAAGTQRITQFSRAVFEALSLGPYMQLFIWLPMIDHSENDVDQIGDLAPFAREHFLEIDLEDATRLDIFRSWQAWDIIRSMCKYSTRLCVALRMPRLLPPTSIQSRWFSEPVRVLTLESHIFTKNAKAYPVLTKPHQALISRFFHYKHPPVWFLLCDTDPIPGQDTNTSDYVNSTNFPTLAETAARPQSKDPTPHLSYLRNLQTKLPAQSLVDQFGAGYQDYLQAPLQPLTVNLESVTYEVFEKDPIKYEWYERAVARALHDWIEQGKPTSNPDGRVVVAVVGAGRGPLVTRALQASEAVGVEVDMWALEKNPNAFVLLQRNNETIWNNRVSLVKSDMRTWRGPGRDANAAQIRKSFNLDPDDVQTDQPVDPTAVDGGSYTGSIETDQNYLLATARHQKIHYKIDILISELLGSFADNELSPECLDGVQHLLNPTHGISIPASYTAHITPIAAPKLHADISLTMTNTPHAAETPYVVMFNAIDFLSTTRPNVPTKNSEPIQASPSSPSKPKQQSYSTAARPRPSKASPDPLQSSAATPADPVIGTTWAFYHPNPSLTSLAPSTTTAPTNSHNNRHCVLSFPIPNRGTCHGLAGYFETVLYPGVELSTNPLTMDDKSEGMISWFPIYFPLKTPIYVPDSSILTLQMWRQTDDRKVWYEWIVDIYSVVSVPDSTSPNDERSKNSPAKTRKVRIGGSELHSSEKEGCLM